MLANPAVHNSIQLHNSFVMVPLERICLHLERICLHCLNHEGEISFLYSIDYELVQRADST